MDPFDVLWNAARGAETPLCVSPKMISNIDSMLDFSHMKLDYHELKFTYVKPQQITPLSNEDWANQYAKIHKNDCSYVEGNHINELCFILSGNEMNMLIQNTTKRFNEACINALDCYNEFRTTIRLLPALSKHDLAGYYDFNMDAYSSVAHTFLGKFYAQMRIVGNIIVFVNMLDEKMHTSSSNNGLFITRLLRIVQNQIKERNELFFCDEYLDIETVITHSNFCAIWSVLEFIFCSPKTFYLSESNPAILLMDTFGDGPVIAAHTFISICNQQSRYKYNSICSHALDLRDMDDNQIEKADLSRFLDNANKVNDIRYFTQSICASFILPPE
jgi:cytoplasmic FMR1 interacting protein